jgi:prepilin-type N-terminal cleavage/methylation domain-containing protein
MCLITSAPPRACHWPVLWYNRAVFPRGISGPAFAALRRGEQRCSGCLSPICRSLISDLRFLRRERASAFTLIELLVVMGIIAILMVLIAPAFTTIKSAGDVTGAAYTIKGVLDTARTYAKANNTYTWVGFYEEDVASTTPGTAGVGRLVMSIVASKDGTIIYSSGSPGTIDTTRLLQVGKLTKVDNVHLTALTDGSGGGSTFDTRPPVTFNNTPYRIGDTSPPNTGTLFQYPAGSPYRFVKAVQFSPGGEARIINSATSYSLQTAAEVGLEPTHGNATSSPTPANLVAIQFGGLGADVIIYRK